MTNRSIRRILAGIPRAFFALALAAAFPRAIHAQSAAPIELRFGSSGTGVGGRPVVGGSVYGYVASKGTLEDELRKSGVEVKWSFFSGAAPAVNEAFANGLLDFAYFSDQASLVGRSSGNRYKVILAANRHTPSAISVPADSRARTVPDLKGKRVALFKGTGSQLQAGRLLEAFGLSEKDLAIVNMNTADAQKALASHQIEAVFVNTSSAIQYQDQGIARLLFNTKDDQRIQGTAGVIVVTEEFEKKHPEIVQQVVDVLVSASHEISLPEKREAALAEWSKSGTPYTVWKRDLDGVDFKDRFDPRIDDDFRRNFTAANEESRRFHITKGLVDIDHGFLEPKYVDASLSRLGLADYWPASPTAIALPTTSPSKERIP